MEELTMDTMQLLKMWEGRQYKIIEYVGMSKPKCKVGMGNSRNKIILYISTATLSFPFSDRYLHTFFYY